MTQTPSIMIADVEARNDALAERHNIDDYYSSSGFLIRFIEQRRLRAIARMVSAGPQHRILEVGCGGGHVLQMFPESELVGVDVSSRMLAKARRNLAGYRVQLLKGELRELDLSPGSFDRVICTEVLEHVDDPEEILLRIRGLIRPGGRVVITFPNDRLVQRLKGLIRATGLTRLPLFSRLSWGGEEFHIHIWRIREMRALLQRYFTIRRQRFVPCRWPAVRCCFLCDVPTKPSSARSPRRSGTTS